MANVKHKFKYVKEGSFRRPLIDITIRNIQNQSTIKYAVLVDSGADFNVFHSDIAKLIGLDLTGLKEIEFGGIEQNKNKKALKGYLANIDIGIDNLFYKTFAIFSNDISPNGHPIVGQKGFFEFFNVQFDYSKNLGYLK